MLDVEHFKIETRTVLMVLQLRTAVLGLILVLGTWMAISLYFIRQRRKCKKELHCHAEDIVLAFFHPYCSSGGGGERVLWVGIQALFEQPRRPFKRIVIYAGDDGLDKEGILKHVQDRFAISFTKEQADKIHIVKIKSRTLLEAKWYPVGTMLFQSLGSMIVGLECIMRFPPDVFCDTMGAAFTYPVVYYLTGCAIAAYVHYPIISTDMLKKVREQRPSYNNASLIASSVTVSSLKLWYYQLFAAAYSWAGRHASVVMVNSSWTRGHVQQLWWGVEGAGSGGQSVSSGERSKSQRTLALVFPPCNTTELLAMREDPKDQEEQSRQKKESKPRRRGSRQTDGQKRIVLSIGQFRPEKDHRLQIQAMKSLVELNPRKYADVELVIMGSTRHADDVSLLESLRDEVRRLQLEDHVRFVANARYAELQAYMRRALVGIHTMWNEHFGISVVEMMAAGLIVVAHNSGGPKMDIVPHPGGNAALASGYLAETPTEYAQAMSHVLDHYEDHRAMRERARVSVTRFSDEVFGERFAQELARAVRANE